MAGILLYRLEYGGKFAPGVRVQDTLRDVLSGLHRFLCLHCFRDQGLDGSSVIIRPLIRGSFLLPMFFRQDTFFKSIRTRRRERRFCLFCRHALYRRPARRWAAWKMTVRNTEYAKVRHGTSLLLKLLLWFLPCRSLDFCQEILCVHCHDDRLLSSKFPFPR